MVVVAQYGTDCRDFLILSPWVLESSQSQFGLIGGRRTADGFAWQSLAEHWRVNEATLERQRRCSIEYECD